MTSRRVANLPAALLVTALVVFACTLVISVTPSANAEKQGAGSGTPAAAGATPAAPQPGEYAGADTCAVCHEGESNAFHATLHGKAQNPRTPMARQACETCHGPGKAHADSGGDTSLIRNPAKLPPRETTAVCASCHNRGEHAFWAGSMHDRRGLSCATCHSVHADESVSGQLVKETQLDVCATCHRDKLAKLDRSGHMPVREGKIQCSTCHNMHGSQNVRMLRVGYNITESCTSCHAEKRGPFLWEHAPVRENCTTCHDPHGSSNERMLVAKQPFLCQRCHVHTRHPATIYDNAVFQSSNRVYGRGCVNCHSAIHGSVHPAGMTFQR